MTAPPDYKELEEQIQTVRKEKEAAIESQEFEKAANLRDRERRLINEKKELEERWKNSDEGITVSIGEDEIAEVVAMWTGIPVTKLTEAETAEAPAHGGGAAQAGRRPGRGADGRLQGHPPRSRRA